MNLTDSDKEQILKEHQDFYNKMIGVEEDKQFWQFFIIGTIIYFTAIGLHYL